MDNSATTRVKPEVVAAMVTVMEEVYGNPSSLHAKGVEAERLVKSARERVAELLRVPMETVYFTSGGTEGNNLCLMGTVLAMRKRGRAIVSKIEHKSVLECAKVLEQQGVTVDYLDVDDRGVVRLDQLQELLCEDTCLVSVMHVNNEVGAVQPLEEMSRMVRRTSPNAVFHVDAVQGFGKLSIPKNIADCITVSAHKIGGPKGVGAVYLRKGLKVKPVLYGGGQEKGVRNGTENVPGIVGFGKAVELLTPERSFDHVAAVKEAMAEQILASVDGAELNSPAEGSPYILNVAVPGLRSEIILHSLEQKGVFVSSGSACASNRPQPSHVLTAMGLSRRVADSSIRISFCPDTTLEQALYGARALADVVRANQSIRK